MTRTLYSLTLFLLIVAGCGNPTDLPPLADFQITVVKDGVPVEGATVSVHSDSLPNNYACNGKTDANGFLVLNTYFHVKDREYKGAPAGAIKIGIRRSGDFGLEDPREATKGMSRDEVYAFNAERAKKMAENEKFVPIALRDPLISPIEFTVEENKMNELKVELNDPQWNIQIDPKRLRKY